MQQNYNKKRKLNKLRASLLLLMMVCFALPVKAQNRANEIRMKTGTETITDAVTYNFYDSGGPYVMAPSLDPNNDYNWVSWYQHNESYHLHLVKPAGYDTKGIKIVFNYLLINNDHLKIYEGDLEDESKLIVDLTNNDYSTGYDSTLVNNQVQKFTVMSHGNMTISFESDYHWRDAGWDASVMLYDYVPQAPVALMEACANNIVLLPGSKASGTNSVTKMYYNINQQNDPDPSDPLAPQTIEYIAPFEITAAPTTVKTILTENGVPSAVATYTFTSLITPPAAPTIERIPNTNLVIIDAHKPTGLNDTYYVRYSINGTDPTASDLEKKDIDTVELTQPCTVRAVVRGTTCPDLFSAENSETYSTIYVPTPVINVTGTSGTNNGMGSGSISCSLAGSTIYYTLDGTTPTTSSTLHGTSPINLSNVPAGTTIKAMAAHAGTGYQNSAVATFVYIPNNAQGEPVNSGVFGSVVLLDDREDHNMTYYQASANLPEGYPTDYLSSPDPRNVKITYNGGSVNNASAVAISALSGENQNQMVYLKTMEKTVLGMTGNYPYTVISNPFSKRPATGSGNNKTYYGFAGWKVISGGEYISEYSNGQTLPLDATIHFTNLNANYTPNCLSADVVFEATWTQATVYRQTSRPSFSGGTYETNFWVLSGNANSNYGGIPANCTMSARYPDGTSSTTDNFTRSLYPRGDNAKVEFISLAIGYQGYVSAEGYTFTVGRGVTNAGTARALYGSNNDKNQTNTIKIESGTYSQLRHFGEDISASRTVNQLMILGCDYDRAKKDNSKLEITGSMYVANTTSLNRTAGTLYVRSIVKSGNFISGTTVGSGYTGSADQCYYFSGFGADDRTGGRRYLVVEGGHLRGISGGTDIENNSTQNSSRAFELRVRGTAQIDGVVYGAAQYANGAGHRTMVFTGGTINGWIAGGANGTQQTDGATNGTSYVYVGGNTKVTSNNSNLVLNRAVGGNVFGAGCGYDATSTSGQVTGGTNVVIADNAYVERGVYGGGSYGYTEATAKLYILGGTIDCKAGGVNGTSYSASIPGGVFGGACQNKGGVTNITMEDGCVTGNIYGGSNNSGTISGNATIHVSGGRVTNIYGGGYGQNTTMAQNDFITITGGTINNNVYGGGALGKVTGNTVIAFSGATAKNIFGAGQGSSSQTANISGTTKVTVSGGTIAECVFGGGEMGNVKQATNPTSKDGEEGGNRDINPVSTVEITGGTIGSNVYGGGSQGFTNGGTLVNMSGGLVEGSVFGGALGLKDKVYVAGQRTVNMRGGTVNKHVYGGSRNADDALTFNPGTFASSNASGTASVVNFAGGYVHYQVFASGYFGRVFGSTFAFIGTNAIINAPNHVAGTAPYTAEYYNQHTALRIGGSVWAGGDFGNYDGTKFGDPTITGRSNVYIDGTGYDTQTNNTTGTSYMYIGGSIYGSGTSCDAGKQGRHIIVRNYGDIIEASQPTDALPYSSATRSLYSIQRADSLVIENSNIVFLGEGKVNSLVTTEKYSIHEFGLVRLANGSAIFLNYPAEQIKKFGSYKVDDVYATSPKYTKVTYETSSLQETPNKVRVNNGAYISIYHDELEYTMNGQAKVGGYGELEGFAYMMSDDANNTCAYARPKQSTEAGNTIPNKYDNPDDGGWVSFDGTLNTYNVSGGTTAPLVQMPYENHTLSSKNGEQYFRIWRAGGTFSYREGVFVAQSDGTKNFSTVDVLINLPAFESDTCSGASGFYRIKSFDGNTTINQGTDVMLVNAACYDTANNGVGGNNWMYINGDNATSNYVTGVDSTNATLKANGLKYIRENPNVNFGLVAIPSGGLVGNGNMLICEASDPKIATMQWTNTHDEIVPQVIFRLTYNNNLTNNVVWDPINITFEQVACDGETVLSTVDVALTVTTLTNIEQDFITQAYAIMRGTGGVQDSYTAKIVLPQYVMHVNTVGEISQWTCTGVQWTPEPGYGNDCFVGGTDFLNGGDVTQCNNKFGMTLVAGLNFDNTTGWESYPVNAKDMYQWGVAPHQSDTAYIFGETTARDPIGFDFTLLYDGRQKANGNYKVGTLTFNMKFTNYEEAGAEPWIHRLTIKIDVWMLGQGANYYIDGVHGNNLYSGKYPNAAKKSLSGIYNRTDYHAGDYIFVVDTVKANTNSLTSWNGKAYSEVTLYRYPGGHQCVPNATGAESHYEGYDITNNPCYQGPLVRVEKDMEMTGIVLNGFYKESLKTAGTAVGDLTTGGVQYYSKYQNANAPLVEILDGGTLTVYGSSRLEYNCNATTDGGGVYIANGGTLNLYDGSAIDTNYVATKNGGGIYVNETSKVQLSDQVMIAGNKKGIPSAKADESVDNNVYLSTYNSHVDVGTVNTDDPYTMLLSTSKVGVTKNNDWGSYWYAPVAYSDGDQNYLANLIGSGIITDDQRKYDLVSLNNTHMQVPSEWLYFVGTWVTEVTSKPDGFEADKIDTPQELAWAISVASGYNGQTAAPNTAFTLTGDIDMNANIWVPIGSNGYPYTGVFNGNGHVVTGLRSPMNQENMGMFGATTGATITDLVAKASFEGGTMKNVGTVIGTMNGGTLSNVEAGGTLTGTATTTNIGGLVGNATGNTSIHSSFAVNTLTGGANTVVGGLVGTNGGDLKNSYSNVTLGANNTATTVGGLVGVNNGTVENCYNATETDYAFVYDNQGSILYCYAADGTTNYVNTGTQPTTHGTYGDVVDRKALGYMYDDNKVTKVGTGENQFITAKDSIYYNGVKIEKWRGLVSTLNQWVGNSTSYAHWYRPTSGDINGDLPVLGFPKDNSLGTTDGKFLRYGSNVDFNGVDALLTAFNDNNEGEAEPAANLFLYGAAANVAKVPASNVNVFINEDAVLLQTEDADDFINTTVGITFDNSCKTAVSELGNTLAYDWHFMSSPLQDAPIKAQFGAPQGFMNAVNITSISDSCYFPNGLTMDAGYDDGVKWDFYTYSEKHYHWINLKRNDHYYQDSGESLSYTNETTFTPGKGYMMAISQDSYMNSTGKLNNGNVEIAITSQEPLNPEYNKGWNLVGNPYQAYLDLSLLFADEANANANAAYVYDADLGIYTPFVDDASENPSIIERYLHQHQAFFVHSKAETDTLTFKPEMATATIAQGFSAPYYRGEGRINYPLVNLFAENVRGNRDLAVIEFNRPELGGATKVNGLRNANFQLAASLEGQRYGLVFTPEGTERVPVHFTTEENGTFTLTWETMHGNFTSLLLVDNMTGTITDMLRADHYTFDATTEDYASRFYLTYTVTGVDEYNEGDGTFAFFDGSEWVVNGKGQLDIVDVTGRVLFSKRLVNERNRVSLNGVANGVYLMRVSDGKNTMVQKIVVK